jgi:Right handed beta helix region
MLRIPRGATLRAMVLFGAMAAASTPCLATDLYVDNLRGSDGYDGRSASPVSDVNGPTKTVTRAVQLARAGDRIIIHNTGVAYYEGISLVGGRHSGFPALPFAIVGNGAVLDGSRAVGPRMWRRVGPDLWKLVPWRKGHFQLIENDKPVPEVRLPQRPDSLPKIPVGRWFAWKGAIYYQAAKNDDPPRRNFRYAFHSVGITLYEVHDVYVADLTLKHFRLDGLNAHDRCRNVTVENLKAIGNGRAGVAVGGTSAVVLRKCEISGNRRNSVLITEHGTVKIEASKLDKPPSGE